MSRKKRNIIEHVEILSAGAEGKAIAKVDDMVIFVEGVVPKDVVTLLITKNKKRYYEARVLKFEEYSPLRVDAFCEHFGVCGGCKWQMLPYSLQAEYKQNQVQEQFLHIGKFAVEEYRPIKKAAPTEYYRNKLEYTFSNNRWLLAEEISSGEALDRNALGFHIPKMYDKIIDIAHCHLQAAPSNEIRNFVKSYSLQHALEFYDIKQQTGYLRNLVIRTTSTGELMVIVIFGRQDNDAQTKLLDALISEFPQISSLIYCINEKKNDSYADLPMYCYSGNDHIIEQMENLKFKISPKSFYQTNSMQAYTLYSVAREFAQLTGNELVYDLYTGTGTIANFIAGGAKKVIGIEYVDDAIQDAVINSQINNINNTLFFAGDMKQVLTPEFVELHGKPDVIITDPPRAGMHADVVQTILLCNPQRIVYVSCNPATQARDIALLSEAYRVEISRAVDMFPHTHHVENVALLVRR